MPRRVLAVLSGAMFVFSIQSSAQPEALRAGIMLRSVATAQETPVRLAHDPSTGDLYYLTIEGSVYRLAAPYGESTAERIATPDEHGAPSPVMGLAIARDGTIYLVGNAVDGTFTSGIIVRGWPGAGGQRTWMTVARTDPYARSNTSYDHNFNGLVLSPDEASLFVNSGSRTDHGELQETEGVFPGLREVALTSAIFRIPADATDLLLPNDEASLRDSGYLFADGVRNSFDQAFDADGRLFATENSGDRDDGEELNWIREGHHYGFPWRLGLNDTPQQFPGYDPAQDLLLNPASSAVQSGFFYNDPTFPSPDGLTFTDPIPNLGPDANRYRDPTTGAILDADATGTAFATFTPHRSPLGLVFDTTRVLPGPLEGDALVLSWTGQESDLLAPFGDEGEDLLHLTLTPSGDSFATTVERLVRGFENPIDAVLVEGRLYVIEFSGDKNLWEITFDANLAAEPPVPVSAFVLDVFPNPAAGAATITLDPARPQQACVAVYDLLGREVARLHDGALAGPRTFSFTADVPAGLYFVRVVGETASATQPLLVR